MYELYYWAEENKEEDFALKVWESISDVTDFSEGRLKVETPCICCSGVCVRVLMFHSRFICKVMVIGRLFLVGRTLMLMRA